MPYIPEHRFQGDLYSSLGEFIILETNVPYEGYYHKLSSGKYFTGKTPYIDITQELVLITTTTPSSFNNTAPVLTLGGLGFPNRNITIPIPKLINMFLVNEFIIDLGFNSLKKFNFKCKACI